MAWNPTEEDVRGRIDELEAKLNGLLLYIAAKEEGIAIDPQSPKGKAFFQSHAGRADDSLLRKSGKSPGGWDSYAAAKIPDYRDAVRKAFGS